MTQESFKHTKRFQKFELPLCMGFSSLLEHREGTLSGKGSEGVNATRMSDRWTQVEEEKD